MKKRIIRQMFDIKPVNDSGSLDWRKIQKVKKNSEIKEFFQEYNQTKNLKKPISKKNNFENNNKNLFQNSEKVNTGDFEQGVFKKEIKNDPKKENSIFFPKFFDERTAEKKFLKNQKKVEKMMFELARKKAKEKKKSEKLILIQEKEKQKILQKINKEKEKKINAQKIFFEKNFITTNNNSGNFSFLSSRIFLGILLILTIGIGGVSFVYKSLSIKNEVLKIAEEGSGNLKKGAGAILKQDFALAGENFVLAEKKFAEGSVKMDQLGVLLTKLSRFFPEISKISSAKNILEVARHLSLAGTQINEIMKDSLSLKNSLARDEISLLSEFEKTYKKTQIANQELILAQENLNKVKIDDLPENLREKFLLFKTELPDMLDLVDSFLQNGYIFADLLGANGPRKFLFLFQNNNEMRPTGGFIGSYGLLDISNGKVKSFFIDGIFNPDGQLLEKIVPPLPIQKISASWSLHDSNWFADFPTSAQKAILFYEKTGGPTVDGVITFTPVVLQKLLKITGPIEMSEYGVILDSENFVEKTQYEVEEDYDKKENKPKKILADLAPILLDKIINSNDSEKLLQLSRIFADNLKEKHILIYAQNSDLQKIISKQGWSGEILQAEKDYLSVINTNINGYKTDGVIEEKIAQQVEVSEDGSLVNTVSVSRIHNGGDTPYSWWNKVNANYMRVYVPKNSKLISVEGQTREINNPLLDYDGLGFKRDGLVQEEENSIVIDPKSGTRIYQEKDKTVFANWTYVSPGETMTITYKYELPFSIFPVISSGEKVIGSYSLLVQKQSGSVGSNFNFNLIFSEKFQNVWHYPAEVKNEKGHFQLTEKLSSDKFIGLVLEKNF